MIEPRYKLANVVSKPSWVSLTFWMLIIKSNTGGCGAPYSRRIIGKFFAKNPNYTSRVVKGMIPDRIFHPHPYPQKNFPSLSHPIPAIPKGMGWDRDGKFFSSPFHPLNTWFNLKSINYYLKW